MATGGSCAEWTLDVNEVVVSSRSKTPPPPPCTVGPSDGHSDAASSLPSEQAASTQTEVIFHSFVVAMDSRRGQCVGTQLQVEHDDNHHTSSQSSCQSSSETSADDDDQLS